jgi:molybdate transport system regulatory protein
MDILTKARTGLGWVIQLTVRKLINRDLLWSAVSHVDRRRRLTSGQPLRGRSVAWNVGTSPLTAEFRWGFTAMRNLRLSVRLDLANGKRIGSGKIELLGAIRSKGSITVAAQHLGMSYRLARVLVQQINDALQQPAVTTSVGGSRGSSGAAVTSVGEEVIKLHHSNRRENAHTQSFRRSVDLFAVGDGCLFPNSRDWRRKIGPETRLADAVD